ncbi:MAG: hypothetical protein SF053_05735 [Bacteroidia bacterium]|nr:hypothetical protein [Bacteroidia bacterium]
MRPQDVAVLLKITQRSDTPWRYADLARELVISQSEVAEALNRSMLARLVDPAKRRVLRSSLMEFLTGGLKYVFPAQPGPVMRGTPTAHAAAPLNDLLVSDPADWYVWPAEDGPVRGQALEPLYPTAPAAAALDAGFYELLALTDAIRSGGIREYKLALEQLSHRILEPAYAR